MYSTPCTSRRVGVARYVAVFSLALAAATSALAANADTGAAAGTAAGADTGADAETLAAPQAMARVDISPSGRRVALLLNDRRDGRRGLAVMDLPPTQPPRVVATFENADVNEFFWVSDERLVYQASEPGFVVREGRGGVFATDHDGQNTATLLAYADSGPATGSRIASRTLSAAEWAVLGRAPSKAGASGDEVLLREAVFATNGEWQGGRMARLNTRTLQLTPYYAGTPARAQSWVFDRQGEPRVVLTSTGGRSRLHLRAPGTESWSVVSDLDSFDPGVMVPLALEGEHELIVRSRGGQDTAGLYVFNLKTRQLEAEPLLAVKQRDVMSARIDPEQGRVAAGTLLLDVPRTVWLTPRMVALQQALDAALPERANTIVCDRCESTAYYLVLSQSDRQPGEYFVVDRAAATLLPLGPTRPGVVAARQPRRSHHWITARDGLPLAVVVTHPLGSQPKRPLPTVVLVHGGPWVPGASTLWNSEAAFLASRGWRVIEPNFRGTLGYGARHLQASFKQWGLAMQDDLTDAVQWAAAEGLADPQRLCIVGASYGGYAALMGPVHSPGLYRCAVSFAGVTDLDLLFSSNQSDVGEDARRYDLKQMVGDPVAERERLRRQSPLHRAAEIKVPVLLVQGLLDRRVPVEHADAFEAAARKAGVDIERLNFASEGHSFSEGRNLIAFRRKMAAFLDRHLKP